MSSFVTKISDDCEWQSSVKQQREDWWLINKDSEDLKGKMTDEGLAMTNYEQTMNVRGKEASSWKSSEMEMKTQLRKGTHTSVDKMFGREYKNLTEDE